ncbi:MAG: phosphoenolpyruvate--protein phosphotransferase [Bacteroidales bacterium]
MALTYTFACPLPDGMHARPASALEEIARRFAATISLTNDRTGQSANAKSVLGTIGLDIRFQDPCRLIVDGADEPGAFATLTRFLERDFPRADDALPVVEPRKADVALPPMLRDAGAIVHQGTPVVPGIGAGRLVAIGDFHIPSTVPLDAVDDVEAEVARVDAALSRVNARYDEQLERMPADVAAAILRAHRAVARDPELREGVVKGVRERRASGAAAIASVVETFTALLEASGSALVRERVLDLRDVSRQLLREMYGEAADVEDVRLTGASVCVATSLTPGQFLGLDRRYLTGLALAHGGTTSHTVILARSFGIPTLVGVSDVERLRSSTEEVVLDAELGVLVTGLTDGAQRYYQMERSRLDARRERLHRFKTGAALTLDGRRLEVAANVGTAEEAALAIAAGAEGVGLFRTEMLFLEREEPPSEEEQFDEYRRALTAAGNKPVIIRTLDVGGDKTISYLRLPLEDNPFLGCRAVRLYPEFESIFRTQVRALVRASAFGRLKVMVPMVSRVEEVRWVREVVAQEQDRCSADGIRFDASMPIGIMVEVPSAVFLLDHLAGVVDFFSIGTNDLLQYFTAVDRANRRIASLSNTLSPAFLRLLKMLVGQAHAHARWVGLCGEMGGDPRALALLVGLGLDEISMAAPAVVRTKAELAGLASPSCAALLDAALACADASEVEALVQRFERARPAPLVDADLVIVKGSARTKEEAIKEAVDRLYVAGRTDTPRDVEAAVWRREAVYSTGFGHGFAIPHCKTDAVSANSLVLLKLESPVEWGSLDEKPVSLLILLAIRESDQATAHMKVLASLARKVMHEEFRAALACETDPQVVAGFMRESLGL